MSSGLWALMAAADGLPPRYWAADDDAYIAGLGLLTPWPRHNRLWEKDSFKYYHSSSRTFVEQVFGQIVSRWGVLWKPIWVSVTRASLLVRVCARLHKLFVKRSSLRADAPFSLNIAGGGLSALITQDHCDLDARLRQRKRDREPCPLRVAFTRRLKQLQCRRPA
eukprot:TRINITY_DN4902_c0_g1_i2.p1 TRINITY_DN4902_c0_g1~~TRINITY_DN4902_c0_g1_i2.p1  ORF type:complete len:165 (-),score=12.91 TRINITY_DN4902_c0_g1_i2:162-656(-)